MRRLTTPEFARVTGIKRGSVAAFRRAVGIEPDHGLLRGIQYQHPYSVQNAVAAIVWRGLLKIGVRREDAAAVSRAIWTTPTEHLEADFARGAKFILCVGPVACPRLLSEEAIRAPEGVPTEVARSLSPVAVDVETIFRGVLAEVSKATAEAS